MLTLLGVGWTISYTNSTRKEDQIDNEKERKEEFDRRNSETKFNLSAQYKPVLSKYIIGRNYLFLYRRNG